MYRTMMFVDGENLVMRYQAMLAEGRSAQETVRHERDVFVWQPRLTLYADFDFVRVSYYTSVVGDEARVTQVKDQFASIVYQFHAVVGSGSGQVVPYVFKKPAQSQKTRSVDIQIAIDMMRFAHNPGIDHIVLVSGDGDYLPLLAEVMRLGKQVYVAALSSGLNGALRHSVDEFLNLDEVFFKQTATPEAASGVRP